MKNPRRLLNIFREHTGRTTHRPAPETDRDKLCQWFVPKVSEEYR